MESDDSFRGVIFEDKCLACGRELIGRGTKRKVAINSFACAYVCYGENICLSPELRELLLEENQIILGVTH